jgi:hypothetical protein
MYRGNPAAATIKTFKTFLILPKRFSQIDVILQNWQARLVVKAGQKESMTIASESTKRSNRPAA